MCNERVVLLPVWLHNNEDPYVLVRNITANVVPTIFHPQQFLMISLKLWAQSNPE